MGDWTANLEKVLHSRKQRVRVEVICQPMHTAHSYKDNDLHNVTRSTDPYSYHRHDIPVLEDGPDLVKQGHHVVSTYAILLH